MYTNYVIDSTESSSITVLASFFSCSLPKKRVRAYNEDHFIHKGCLPTKDPVFPDSSFIWNASMDRRSSPLQSPPPPLYIWKRRVGFPCLFLSFLKWQQWYLPLFCLLSSTVFNSKLPYFCLLSNKRKACMASKHLLIPTPRRGKSACSLSCFFVGAASLSSLDFNPCFHYLLSLLAMFVPVTIRKILPASPWIHREGNQHPPFGQIQSLPGVKPSNVI